MLDVPSWKAIGVETGDDFLGHEVPVGQEHDVGDALTPQVAQSQIHALVNELVVLIVAVDERDSLEPMPCELPHEGAADADDGGGVEAERTDDVIASAGALLRLVSGSDGRPHQSINILGDEFGHLR